MQYWGKIIGVAVALMMGGGFWGVVLGLLVGHMFDKARSRKMAWFANQRERQALFFATTFEVMGHLTKSKGRVTEADIHIASQLMDRMNLHGDSRTAAQNAFRVGKADNYPLREKMRQFRSVCFGRFDLIRMFLEIQIQAAFADGSLHPNEREVLYVIAEELGISRVQFDQFLRMMQGGAQFGGGYHQQSGGGWQQQVFRIVLRIGAAGLFRAYRFSQGHVHIITLSGLSRVQVQKSCRSPDGHAWLYLPRPSSQAAARRRSPQAVRHEASTAAQFPSNIQNR